MKIRLVALLTAVLALTGAGVAAAGGDPGTAGPTAGTAGTTAGTAGTTAGTAGRSTPAVKKGAPPAAGTQNLGAYRIATGLSIRLPPYGFGSSTATCPAGLVPTGGGESNTSNGNFVLTDSYPTGTNSWTVYVKNLANEIQSFTAYAICGV